MSLLVTLTLIRETKVYKSPTYKVTLLFACYKNPSTVIELERGSAIALVNMAFCSEAFMTTQKWLLPHNR